MKKDLLNSGEHIAENQEQGKFLRGIPASPGLVLGKAIVIKHKHIFVQSNAIPQEEIPNEIQRLQDALNILTNEYEKIIKNLPCDAQNIRGLLESNLMMFQDTYIRDSIISSIKTGNNTENAVNKVFDILKNDMSDLKDILAKDRSLELDQIKQKILLTLRNQTESINANESNIVVASFFTPDELMQLKEMGVKGIITEVGGITSHTSILSRNFNISSIISVKDATSIIKNNDLLILDGYSGSITVNPSAKTLEIFNKKKKTEASYREKLGEYKDLPTETSDGKKITLKANIDLAEDIDIIQMLGTDGIGLVRTEYIVLNKGRFPNSEEQYNLYKKITERIYPSPVTFRVFDLGSDKIIKDMPQGESNPALGLRGIRFLLERQDIFREQICAILRASKNKNVKILLPMLTSISELNQAKDIINDCKKQFEKDEIPFDKNIPLGVMIETPASALLASEFAKHCDFLSIGTNDLTQYTLAADRTNEMVAHQYDAFHPAVLKLIKMTVDAGKKNNKPVAICGELGGHPAATELLIGLDVDEFSVAPSIFLEVKKKISELSYEQSKITASDLMNSCCLDEIKKKIGL